MKHFLLISFASLLLFINSCQDLNPGAVFNLSIDNEYIIKGETIWVNAEFINRMKDSIKLTGQFKENEGFKIVVLNEKKEEIKKGIIEDELFETEDTVFYLKPNDTLRTIFNLSWYNTSGSYIYVNSSYNNIASNSLKIKIKEPEEEDKIVLVKINEYNERYSAIDTSNTQKEEFLKKIIFEHSDSRLIPEVYYLLLMSLYFKNDTTQYLKHLHEYLDKYADNPETSFIISGYFAFLKVKSAPDGGSFNKDEVRNSLLELQRKYSGNKKLKFIINECISSNIDIKPFKLKKE